MQAVTRQLSLVKFDDCFITTCPDRPVLPENPPTYPAFCLPDAESPMPYLNAFRGPWRDVGNATADIKPALSRGDALSATASPTLSTPTSLEASVAHVAVEALPRGDASAVPADTEATAVWPADTQHGADSVDIGAVFTVEDAGANRSVPAMGGAGTDAGVGDASEDGGLGEQGDTREVSGEGSNDLVQENAPAFPTPNITVIKGDGVVDAQRGSWAEWSLQLGMPSMAAAVMAVLLLLVCVVRLRAQHRFRKLA